MRIKIGLALALCAFPVSMPSASAHDHAPPSTTLRVGDEDDVQDGLPSSYCWMQASESGYVRQCADYPWRFPDLVSVPHGAHARIRFWTASSPTSLSVFAWALTNRGEPVGPGEKLPVSSVFRDGAWEGDLELLVPCRAYYIAVRGSWDDVDGLGAQDASWTFALTPTLPLGLQPIC